VRQGRLADAFDLEPAPGIGAERTSAIVKSLPSMKRRRQLRIDDRHCTASASASFWIATAALRGGVRTSAQNTGRRLAAA
jgi:hypothetical protein